MLGGIRMLDLPIVAHVVLLRLVGTILLMVAPAFAFAADTEATFELPLFLHEDQGVGRDGEPVAGGIPFPQGAVLDAGHIRIYDPEDRPVPCQAHQLGITWPDGSLRWALVQFQGSVAANETASYTLRVEPHGRVPSVPTKVTVRDLGGHVLVATGPLQFSLSRVNFRLPNRAWVSESGTFDDEDKVLDNSAAIKLIADHEHMTREEFEATGRDAKELASFGLADAGEFTFNRIERGIDYSNRFAGLVEIEIEESGPLRAVLRIEKAGEKPAEDLGFVARVYAYAGKRLLRIELSVINYDEFIRVPSKDPKEPSWRHFCISNTKHVRRYTYSLMPLLGEVRAVELGTNVGARSLPASQTAGLVQYSHEACTLRSGEITEDLKGPAPGWIEVQGTAHGLALASKYFAETYPKALSYEPDSGLVGIDLWPSDTPGSGYPLAPGRMRTYEFLLAFDMPGDELSGMARAELRPYPDPEYVTATGATHRFVPLQDERFSKYARYVERTYDTDLQNRLYGDIDYGDQIGWNADQRWNGYHGVTHEWFLFYLASGEPRYFRVAEATVWHSMDVDTFHCGPLSGAREAEYGRKHDHVCPSAIQGSIKVWNFGEVDYYFLTGKRRVWENLRENARWLMKCGGVTEGNLVPERATSLPFLHLCYMYEALGSEQAIAELYPDRMQSARGYPARPDCLGLEESRAQVATLKRLNHYLNGVYDRGEHVQSSFLCSYPAEAFHRFYKLTGDESAAEGIIKAADFLYHQMIIPTGIIKYAGGPPWHDLSPWMPWWDGVEAPAALAYIISGDSKYLTYGNAAVDWVLNYRWIAYSSGPWSWQGAMGMGGTLPTFLWAMREAGMTQDDLTTVRPDIDYDAALDETTEMAMSYFDAASENSQESGIFCRLAAEVGRVLINLGRYDEAIAWLEKWQGKPYSVYVAWVLARARNLKAESELE